MTAQELRLQIAQLQAQLAAIEPEAVRPDGPGRPTLELLAVCQVVAYPPDLARVVGGVAPGLLLRQAIYHSMTASDDDGWFRWSQEDIESETALTRREYITARDALLALGVIEQRTAGRAGSTYRVLWQELDQQCARNARIVKINARVLHTECPTKRAHSAEDTLYKSKTLEDSCLQAGSARIPDSDEQPPELATKAGQDLVLRGVSFPQVVLLVRQRGAEQCQRNIALFDATGPHNPGWLVAAINGDYAGQRSARPIAGRRARDHDIRPGETLDDSIERGLRDHWRKMGRIWPGDGGDICESNT